MRPFVFPAFFSSTILKYEDRIFRFVFRPSTFWKKEPPLASKNQLIFPPNVNTIGKFQEEFKLANAFLNGEMGGVGNPDAIPLLKRAQRMYWLKRNKPRVPSRRIHNTGVFARSTMGLLDSCLLHPFVSLV